RFPKPASALPGELRKPLGTGRQIPALPFGPSFTVPAPRGRRRTDRQRRERHGLCMDDHLITTTPELADVCARLAKFPVITVDTEFLRESTYYPLLCVVQMASPDEAVVVDALAEGIDLKPFFDLMSNEGVLKVFHAARQDIEIVFHLAGIIPHPIFDTQVAAMVLGYGDSIAYDQLVERVTGHRP